MIFKNPKTDTGNFKKSQSGLCRVYRNRKNEITYEDGHDKHLYPQDQENVLECVYRDGKMMKEYKLADIRKRLHGGAF